MFPFVSKWLSSISNDQLWLKGGGREAREAVDASNVMCQEGNNDEDGEIFFRRWRELKAGRSVCILDLTHEISFHYI